MKLDLSKASEKLSKLNIDLVFGDLMINVLWIRARIWKRDWLISRHKHSSFELHIIKSGTGRVILDNDEFEVYAGDFYITLPGIHHEQRNLNNDNYIEYCINFDLKLVDCIDSKDDYIYKVIKNAVCKKYMDRYGLTHIFENILSEALNGKLGFYHNIQHLIFMLINNTARTLAEEMNIIYDFPTKKTNSDIRFNLLTKFINDNISHNIQTANIAEFMYLSEKQVSRIIKNATGMSAYTYITSIKLKKSKEFLKNTDLSLKEIASALGFSSEYYFSSFFSKHEGYPPGHYRKNVHKH